MGTSCRVTFSPGPGAKPFQQALLEWIANFEARYSRFLPESLVSEINRNAGKDWVAIDEETERILSLCDEAHFITYGTFDPTALPLIQLWNWKAEPPTVPTAEAIARAKMKVGWRKVKRAPGEILLPETGMSLDLGGIGKEYAVDQAIELASGFNITNILVDFGQDIFAQGVPPGGSPSGWRRC